MEKHILIPSLILLLIFIVTGCKPSDGSSPVVPNDDQGQHTLVSPVSTIVPTDFHTTPSAKTENSPIPTYTATVPAQNSMSIHTLEPTRVNETITAFMQRPGECVAPCLWGIVPGKTTNDEVNSYFFLLGISPFYSTVNGRNLVNYEYQMDADLSVDITFAISNNLVESQNIRMNTSWVKARPEADWMSYSPKTIIEKYGNPSRIEFYWSLGQKTTFTMIFYFDSHDLIAEFESPDGPEPNVGIECPLAVTYDGISLWMGKNPINPPRSGVPIENGANMTTDEFTKMMTGNSKTTCFRLSLNAFLPIR